MEKKIDYPLGNVHNFFRWRSFACSEVDLNERFSHCELPERNSTFINLSFSLLFVRNLRKYSGATPEGSASD